MSASRCSRILLACARSASSAWIRTLRASAPPRGVTLTANRIGRRQVSLERLNARAAGVDFDDQRVTLCPDFGRVRHLTFERLQARAAGLSPRRFGRGLRPLMRP